MSGGEAGSGSGLAFPSLGHCLAEQFGIDLPQQRLELAALGAVVAEPRGHGEDACEFPEVAPLGEVPIVAGLRGVRPVAELLHFLTELLAFSQRRAIGDYCPRYAVGVEEPYVGTIAVVAIDADEGHVGRREVWQARGARVVPPAGQRAGLRLAFAQDRRLGEEQ